MKRWQIAALAGAAATLSCFLAVAWTNDKERSLRREELEREAGIVASQLTGRVLGGLQQHAIAIRQLAAFFEHSDDVTEREFHDFAASTSRLTPLCSRIPVLGPSFRVKWVHPPGPNATLVGFDAATHPKGYEALLRAARTRELALSVPLKLVGGVDGFTLTAPMFRGEELLGAVVCSIRSADFFEEMAVPQLSLRYGQTITDAGASVLDGGAAGGAPSTSPVVTQQLALGGRTWQVQVTPREEVYLARLHSGETSFWILGCLFSLALGTVVCGATYRATGMAIRIRAQEQALVHARARLDGATERLVQAEKLTALGDLVAGVAHEVNNPLSGVLGYTQLVLREELPPEVRRRLDTVASEAQRAAKIVRNLLTFARKHPPEKKYLGVNGIIEKTLELKAYHFRVSQIEVEKDLAPDLPMTMLDFHQIQQVLLNLLNNAEQAMAPAAKQGSVRVSSRRVGDNIEVRIADTGPGIAPQDHPRIFEPFFTTKKDGAGTGLGLSLCYGIIEEHGGGIRAESVHGQGATFIIELPIVGPPRTVAEAPAAPAAPRVGSLRILVIDDEPSLQGVLMDLLTAAGHRVDTAADVPEALHKIAAGGQDLIISDMKMPHGSGRDIYEAVASRNPDLARRVVFTTGDGANEETLRFFNEIGGQMLLKPYRLEDIERVIANVVRS